MADPISLLAVAGLIYTGRNLSNKVERTAPQEIEEIDFTGVEPEEKTISSLNKLNFSNTHQVWKLVSGWHYGRYRIMQSEKSRQLLTILIPKLLNQ